MLKDVESVTCDMGISVNKHGFRVLSEAIERAEELAIIVEKSKKNSTIVDMGVNANGGYLAGKYLTDVCMGGLSNLELGTINIGDLVLPSIIVSSDYPSIALLGSQFAGWRISVGDYFAMGSGPARAISLKPKEIYHKIDYHDESEIAVIVLETDNKPPDDAYDFIAEKCKVKTENLYVAIASTSSVAGSTQISGRIVESGLHKLTERGIDPKKVKYGLGEAPIAPIHPKSMKAMGRTNDMILYGGRVYFEVEYEDDTELEKIVKDTPSSASKSYGKPFYNLFKEAGFDFYKIDAGLFAPAVVTVNNLTTGKIFSSGKINEEILKKSIGYIV
jgi:methenyltetrahydromethanopterin cyclohydrolase